MQNNSNCTLVAKAAPGGRFHNLEYRAIYNSNLKVDENRTMSLVNTIIDGIILRSVMRKD